MLFEHLLIFILFSSPSYAVFKRRRSQVGCRILRNTSLSVWLAEKFLRFFGPSFSICCGRTIHRSSPQQQGAEARSARVISTSEEKTATFTYRLFIYLILFSFPPSSLLMAVGRQRKGGHRGVEGAQSRRAG